MSDPVFEASRGRACFVEVNGICVARRPRERIDVLGQNGS